MPISKSAIPRIATALFLLVALCLVVWKLNDKGGQQTSSGGGSSPKVRDASSGVVSDDQPGDPFSPGRTRPRNARGTGNDTEEAPQFPMVDAILADSSLNEQEAAKRLLEIVNRPDTSLLEREEALAHGLNLEFSLFSGLVEDPKLPQPLALQVFDAMLNENQARDVQVKVCMALLNHEDEGLRNEAAEQLGFYIGFEELVDQPDVLKQEAAAFLEEWAKRPRPESEPVDPDADIPETQPIIPEDDQDETDSPEPDDSE